MSICLSQAFNLCMGFSSKQQLEFAAANKFKFFVTFVDLIKIVVKCEFSASRMMIHTCRLLTQDIKPYFFQAFRKI